MKIAAPSLWTLAKVGGALVAVGSLWVTWLSYQTAKEQFTFTYRPRIAPPVLKVLKPLTCAPLTGGGTIELQATFQNRGDAPAKDALVFPRLELVEMRDVQAFLDKSRRPNCADLVPTDMPAYQVLPGHQVTARVVIASAASKRSSINASSWRAFLINCVWYFDEQGVPHQSCDLRQFTTPGGQTLLTCFAGQPIAGNFDNVMPGGACAN